MDVFATFADPHSGPRRLAKLTHFCSRKSTHTGNTICACLPAGKNRHAPPPCFCFLVTRSFFPNQFILRRPATARRRRLAAVQVVPVYKWCWVTLGEQTRGHFSRAPKYGACGFLRRQRVNSAHHDFGRMMKVRKEEVIGSSICNSNRRARLLVPFPQLLTDNPKVFASANPRPVTCPKCRCAVQIRLLQKPHES